MSPLTSLLFLHIQEQDLEAKRILRTMHDSEWVPNRELRKAELLLVCQGSGQGGGLIFCCASRPCGKRSWKTPCSEFEALSSNGLSNEAGQGGMPKQTLCYRLGFARKG